MKKGEKHTLSAKFHLTYCDNPLQIRNPQTGTLANSGNADEMPYYVAFHQGLHCLVRQNLSSDKYNIFLEIITGDPSKYTMDHPDYYSHALSI